MKGKKIISLLLFIILILNIYAVIPAFAYTYPTGFWTVNPKYEAALNSNDYANIIKYGLEELGLVKPTTDCYEKREIMATRYNAIGKAYVALGNYDSAYQTFSELYDFAKNYDEYYDYARGAHARMLQYKSSISLYTDNGTYTYYGAANEKKNGVLFGLCSNGGARSSTEHESMVLTYQELGQTLLSYNTSIVKKAAAEGQAVEFALNCPNEGTDIKNIKNMTAYLKEISDLFSKYHDIPIYLRFAAEFDIWDNPTDAEPFKTAFRIVSQYFKNRNDNVAMVWSPNQVASWNIKDIDEYYPGDEYVDWVGISLYAERYFLSDKNSLESNEIAFKSGVNSDPVIAVKDIVGKYGDRKPIMISESGCGHRLVKNGNATGEDTSEFAIRRLKEYMNYLPMVYPQIKLMAYFDWYVDSDSVKSDFRLSTNTELKNEYVKLTKTSRFIQDEYDNETDFCYRQIANGTSVNRVFPVSCYAHKYNTVLTQVSYFIDGKYAGMSNEIPYTTYIDATGYSGTHTLKAVATFLDGQTLTIEQSINISNMGDDITVEISGDEIEFDQNPILYNERTMVPMRKIFEELGATVTWDNDTQTATGKKGDRTVKVTVGSKVMYVNNTKYELDTAPIIVSRRTLVPVRAVAEGMGCEVDWDSRYSLVSITPKVFKWSDWDEDLPSYVTSDLYYIEEETEYRYRTRDKEYFTRDYKISASNYVDSETTYGSWSDWQDSYMASSDTLQVETRTQSSPKSYHYAHYCTGNESDSSIRYKTSNYQFCDDAIYHDLGWFDSKLPEADDGVGYIKYKDDGSKYRCSNTCYRWYLVESTGGTYTQYRSRSVMTTYTYWSWGDWSKWSGWDEEDPYDDYDGLSNGIDVDERTVYRYKGKG